MAFAVISVAFEGREHASAPLRFIVRRGDALWIGAAIVFVTLALYNPDPARAPTIGAGLADSVVSAPFLDLALREFVTTIGPLIFVACFALAVMIGDWGGGLVRRFLSFRFLVWVGVISYAMYIWQEALGVTLGLPAEIRVGEHANGLGLIGRFQIRARPSSSPVYCSPSPWPSRC
jgi:peptidoglycan/LPS O-acetylase OafA/YrhL